MNKFHSVSRSGAQHNRQITHQLPMGVDGGGFMESSQYNDTPIDPNATGAAASVGFGEVEYSVDFQGRVTAFHYDNSTLGAGRLVAKYFYNDLSSYLTDLADATPSALDHAAQAVFYTYDAFGRVLTTNSDLDGNQSTFERTVTNTYDGQGRLTRVDSPEGAINYEYDPATGRLIRTYTGNAAPGGISGNAGYVATANDGIAVTDTEYTYDNQGRLSQVIVHEEDDQLLSTPATTQYSYDLVGNLFEVDSPGVISRYSYDALNRLTKLAQYRPDSTPATLVDNTELAEFDYTLDVHNRRTSATEMILDSSDQQQWDRFEWFYDNLGRLTEERFDEGNDGNATTADDFIADYKFDLVGNRLEKDVDLAADVTTQSPSFDQFTSSTYDRNDRLLQETTSGPSGNSITTYLYGNGGSPGFYGGDGTEQTDETVWSDSVGGTKQSETTFTYNLQGQMDSTTKTSYDTDGSTITSQTTTSFTYDDDGVRVSQTVGGQKTVYLVDSQNPTGYSQTLEEKNSAGEVQKNYTIGQDVISQSVFAGPAANQGRQFLLYDGHGSTRALVSATGAILINALNSIQQRFTYDAYGNLVIRLNSVTTIDQALTSLLYSGEQTDQTGLQYLRARYYDPISGRFNKLDPFAGNVNDPLSLHKYLYTQANPINGVDPSGQFLELLLTLSLEGLEAGAYAGVLGGVGGGLIGGIDAALGGDNVLEGAWNGAKLGAELGFTFGFLSPFAALLFPVAVKTALLNMAAGASLTIGAYTGGEAFGNGHLLQGIFRLGVGFLGAYKFRNVATAPNRPVNIGGDGEVPGAVNLQPRSALGPNWASSRESKSLAQLIGEGNDFQIYNAKAGGLPYPDNSVPTVYTNNVPIGKPYPGNAPITRAEIERILVPGGQWIDNGEVLFTKPSG